MKHETHSVVHRSMDFFKRVNANLLNAFLNYQTKKFPPKETEESIDQTIEDSFPASDPPSHTPVTGSGHATH